VRWHQPLAALLGIGIVAAGVDALQDAAESRHDPRPPGTVIELVVDASIHRSERGQTLAERVEAKILSCRLEVRSDLAEPIRSGHDGRFVARLTPSMDASNRRQFRGCLEDWTIEHVKMDVVRLAEVAPR